MRSQFISTALEAVQFQKDKDFVKGITALMASLKAEPNVLFSKIPQELSALITKHTFIKNTVNIPRRPAPNASVYPPRIDASHPLIKEEIRGHEELSRQGRDTFIRKLPTVGWVDLEEGTVHGVYREITVSFHLNMGLFNASLGLTSEELTAILLHEIGHCFTYFEYLGSKISRNLAMVSLTEKLFGIESSAHEKRVELLTIGKAALDLKTLDVNRLLGTQSKREAILVLIDAEAKRLRSELGTDFYDATSWEYISDQYVARQGAALALVTGNAKIGYKYKEPAFLSTLEFMVVEISKVLLFLITTLLTAGIYAVYLVCVSLSVNPLFSEYDQPKARLIRVRQQIIAQISETDDTDVKRQLVNDIKTVDVILGDMNDYRTLYEYIFTRFVKSNKKDLDQQQIQKDLEAIGMNDLFVSAARLQTLL